MSEIHDIITSMTNYNKRAVINQNGEMGVVVSQDLEPIYDSVKEIKDLGRNGFSADKEIQLYARIPLIFIKKWQKEGFDFYLMDESPESTKKLQALIERDCPEFKIAKGSLL